MVIGSRECIFSMSLDFSDEEGEKIKELIDLEGKKADQRRNQYDKVLQRYGEIQGIRETHLDWSSFAVTFKDDILGRHKFSFDLKKMCWTGKHVPAKPMIVMLDFYCWLRSELLLTCGAKQCILVGDGKVGDWDFRYTLTKQEQIMLKELRSSEVGAELVREIKEVAREFSAESGVKIHFRSSSYSFYFQNGKRRYVKFDHSSWHASLTEEEAAVSLALICWIQAAARELHAKREAIDDSKIEHITIS